MFNYTVETKGDVQEIVDRLRAKLKENSFGVLHIYNLKEIFKSKGIEFGEYQILSVCNPKFAKDALDANLKVGVLLPCKISVYTEQGVTKISLLKPTAAIGLLGEQKLDALAKNVEDILNDVINSI
ncbi:MAG: DUF302 domain-containing protein [Chloroflexi bacterium]|nr:DUF302 domain-containing protein [Chloroflexota bacterium]